MDVSICKQSFLPSCTLIIMWHREVAHPLWTRERGGIHHSLLVILTICKFPLSPQWSKHHNLSIRVTDLYTISTPRGCGCPACANTPFLMTCRLSASLCMVLREAEIRCGLQVHLSCRLTLWLLKKSMPLLENTGSVITFSLPFDLGQNVASQFSFHMITASLTLLWAQNRFEHVCKCALSLRAAEHYLFKMHRRQTAAILKELFRWNISNLQQIFYLVVWVSSSQSSSLWLSFD